MNIAALEHCGWRPLVGFAVERLKVINAEHHMSEFSINWTLGEILTNVHFTWYVLQCLAAVDTREKAFPWDLLGVKDVHSAVSARA